MVSHEKQDWVTMRPSRITLTLKWLTSENKATSLVALVANSLHASPMFLRCCHVSECQLHILRNKYMQPY